METQVSCLPTMEDSLKEAPANSNRAKKKNIKKRVFEHSSPCSLPKAVVQLWPDEFPTPSSAKKRIRKGFFSLDGFAKTAKCGVQVQPGDVVYYKVQKVACMRTHINSHQLQSDNLRVAYIDPMLVVAVKPYGVSTSNEKGSSPINNTAGSLYQRLLYALPDTTSSFPLRRPAVVHRLDKPTYGLVIAARTTPAARALGAAFESSSSSEEGIYKRYRAVVYGRMDTTHGYIREALDGKLCESEWSVVKTVTIPVGSSTTTLTLLDLFPHTGRYHQLRRHLARINKPIVGDARHGWEGKDAALSAAVHSDGEALNLMLAAVEITFPHPDCKEAIASTNKQQESIGDTPGNKDMDGAMMVQKPKGDVERGSKGVPNDALRHTAEDMRTCQVSVDFEKGASYHLDENTGMLNVSVHMPCEMVGLLGAGAVETGRDGDSYTQI
jgi:23S rRNA-/tRNA-specific pseudouridylate synthase